MKNGAITKVQSPLLSSFECGGRLRYLICLTPPFCTAAAAVAAKHNGTLAGRLCAASAAATAA